MRQDIGIVGIGGFRFLKYTQEYFKINLKRFAHSRTFAASHTQVPYNSFNIYLKNNCVYLVCFYLNAVCNNKTGGNAMRRKNWKRKRHIFVINFFVKKKLQEVNIVKCSECNL